METKTIKILAIDDNQDNLITLKALINESFNTVKVYTALSGKIGLEIAALENPDVILLDILMPEMDGYEVCQILKADHNLKEIPVVFVTALKGEKAIRIKALEAGAEAFLAKPIDESELIAQIKAMVKIKEANFEKLHKEKILLELVAEKTKSLEESNQKALRLLEDLIKENEARRLSEQAVIESENKYSKAFQTSPYCITITSLSDGVFVDVNDSFCEVTGYTKEEVIGNTVENVQIWFNLVDRKQLVDNLLANEKIENHLGYFKKKNGEKIIGLFSAQIHEINGVAHILASINDITKQKLAEDELIKSKEQYQELVAKIPVGVYVLRSKPDGSFMFEYVSPKMEEIIQIKAQSILENPANAFLNFHPEDLPFLIQENADAIASKEPALIVGRLLINEKVKWVEISSNPEILANGDILWHGLISDITEQKIAEENFKEAHEKLEVLMDAIPDLLFEVDFDGTIYNYHVNNNDLLFDSPDNFLGKKFVDILPEKASKVCQSAIIEASEKGISTGKQYSLQFPQGEQWFDISVAPIKNIEDQISRFVILARDVTEQKKSVLELVKLNRTQALNSQINNLIIRIHDKMKLFEEVCEIATTYGNFRMSWVSQINEQTKVISPLVWYGHEEGYLKEIQKISIENNLFGNGPTGVAFREGKTSVCNNIATDPKMELWREEALKRGYFSSIALPIIVRGNVIGTFNLYAGEVDFFALNEEVELLENITANIAFSLEKILDEEDRLKAEQKVREKDKEFGKLSANVSDLLYQFTRRPDGSYFVPIASAGIINIFGCKPEDVADNFDAIAAVLYPEDAERVINEIEYSAAHLTFFTCEFRVQIPGKPIQWIYSKSNPEKLADGSVTWYGFNTDITERKLAEQELLLAKENAEKSENKLKVMVNAMPDLVWFKDSDGVYLECNKRFENFIGFSQEQLLGKTDYDLFDQELADFFRNNDKKAIAIGKSTINEERVTFNNDGHQEDLETIKTPIYDSNKNIIGVLGIGRNITERKQAEILLKEKEERHRAITQTANDAIVTSNNKGEITGWNRAAEKIFGYSNTEIVGKPLTEIIPPHFKELHEKGIERFENNGEKRVIGKTVEMEGLHKNGTVFPLELSLAEWETSTGKFITGFIKDITERKKAELELEKNLSTVRKLSVAINQSPVTTVITDLEGKIIFVNPKFTEVTGYTFEEAIGQNPRVLNSGHTTKEEYKELWDKILSGKNWHGVFQNKKKNGDLFWENAVISPVKNEQGIITNFLAVKEDITEKRLAELALIESNERYNLVAKATNDSIWDLNILTNEIVRSGGGFEVLFGYNATTDNIDYTHYRNLIHPDDLDKVIASKNKVFNSPNEYNWEQDYRFLKANGEYAFVHDKGFIIRDENGKAIRMIGATQDVTEREKYVNAIENQNRKLRDIAWLQSHVVRAPLARMMGIVDLLNDVEFKSEEFKVWVDRFNKSSAELDQIIRDISNKSAAFDL